MLALVLFAFWWMRARRRTVVAFLIVLGGGPYLAELILASGLAGSASPTASIDRASNAHREALVELARSYGVEMDTRNRADLIADFHARHVDAVTSVMIGPLLETDGVLKSASPINEGHLVPLGGVSRTLTVLCNESGQYVTYVSDEHGFRNPKGIWAGGRVDLAAVGESTVAGYCVSEGKGFVDRLRAHFPATLNLGMSGHSGLLQLAAIKEYLPVFAPKVVLWVFSEETDLPDLYAESKFPFLMRYLEPSFTQGLLRRQPEIDSALRGYLWRKETRERQINFNAKSDRGELLLERMKLTELRTRVDTMYGLDKEYADGLSTLDPAGQDVFSRALSQAKTITGSWGGRLYFVYIPSWVRYAHGWNAAERERTRVFQRVRDLGVPIIDTRASVDAQLDPRSLFWFRQAVHLNDAGNEVVARTVLNCLAADQEAAHITVVRAENHSNPPDCQLTVRDARQAAARR